MGNLLIGSTRPSRILLGANDVSKIYVGTSLVWERITQADIWTYFDNGVVNDITWSNDAIPAPEPNYYGTTAYYADEGNMLLRIRKSSGTAETNHVNVATTNLIRIPSGATRLLLYGRARGYAPQIRFGLFPANAPDSNTTTGTGGVQSPLITSSTSYRTETLNLPTGYAGSSQYRIVIAARGSTNQQRDYRIHKVWFE